MRQGFDGGMFTFCSDEVGESTQVYKRKRPIDQCGGSCDLFWASIPRVGRAVPTAPAGALPSGPATGGAAKRVITPCPALRT